MAGKNASSSTRMSLARRFRGLVLALPLLLALLLQAAPALADPCAPGGGCNQYGCWR
jgi:hypothetical protein